MPKNLALVQNSKSTDITSVASIDRMELLIFRLKNKQLYGINVFKVKEIIPCPKLINLPHAAHEIRGVAHVRGSTVSVLDLCIAMNEPPIENPYEKFVIITEYNMRTQGLLVEEVERIINVNWSDVMPPPDGSGRENFLTAVTQVENELIEIIDVEKIIYNTNPHQVALTDGIVEEEDKSVCSDYHILIVDDSSTARLQIAKNLEPTGVQVTSLGRASDALEYLTSTADELDKGIEDVFMLAIVDIEMPGMDGFTFINKLRENPKLAKLPVVLHSSLSGIFNDNMVEKVGADYFLPKYNADKLAQIVIEKAHELNENK